MKKLMILALLALTVSVAQAAEQPLKVYKFNFKCDFKRDNGPDFSALATVYADVNNTWSIGEQSRDYSNAVNLIAVAVDDTLIVASNAILNSQDRYVQIQSVNGSPSIFVRRDQKKIGTEWMKYDAFLAFDSNRRIPGTCQVRSDLGDHDHDELQ
jgi:hypothetical protein